MRRAYNAEICEINDKVLGINLGADFVSEHEWGINGILKDFGVNRGITGIDGYTTQSVPKNLIFSSLTINKQKHWILSLINKWWIDEEFKINKDTINNMELTPRGGELNTAWDESSFGILTNEDGKYILDRLYAAFVNKDIAIGIAPKQAFRNGGLKFFIRSEMDVNTIKNIYEQDIDRIKIKETAENTGIYNILKNAGKKYFALSPRWKDENKKEVVFWLNPMEQHLYNFGWYTVNDLIEWANNKGKIIKEI